MSYHIIEDHKIEYHIMKITLLKIILLNIIFLKIILLKIILLAPLLKCFFSSVANETLLPRQDFPRISAALFSQQMLWRKVQSKGFWSFKRNNDIETKGSPEGWVPHIGSDLEERQDTGKHNDRGGEQAFCADVEEGVSAVVMICTIYNGYSIMIMCEHENIFSQNIWWCWNCFLQQEKVE